MSFLKYYTPIFLLFTLVNCRTHQNHLNTARQDGVVQEQSFEQLLNNSNVIAFLNELSKRQQLTSSLSDQTIEQSPIPQTTTPLVITTEKLIPFRRIQSPTGRKIGTKILKKIVIPQETAPIETRNSFTAPSDPINLEEFRRQAETAKYQFSSDIEDNINGQLHQREEERNGLNVHGKYSYSDGYYRRTVQYEADDKGYRVVKETVEPIGEGPEYNPEGLAKVSSLVAGTPVKYEITEDDLLKNNKHKFGYNEIPIATANEDENENENI